MKFLILLMLLVGCGSEREVEPKGGDPPEAPVISVPLNFSEVKPLLATACIRCHANDGFLTSEARWKASNGPARVKNKSMPQAGSPEAKALSDLDRARILSLK